MSVSMIERVSDEPGSPLSVSWICSVLLPPIEIGAVGLVTSVRFALLVNVVNILKTDVLYGWRTRGDIVQAASVRD